ncbi:MAG: penicillin-binding protein 1C [Oligoflexia bacterium]|nr:penicillin-binding protein 1C [Oligoflexia bacterium]
MNLKIFSLVYLLLSLSIFISIPILNIDEGNAKVQEQNQLPSFEQVKNNFHSSEILLLDRNDILLKKIRYDFSAYKLDWIKLSDISPDFLKVLLFSEDKNFYSHKGVAWISLLSATFAQLKGNSKRGGASTISMQLIKIFEANKIFLNVNKSQRRKSNQLPILRKIRDKIDQVKDARELEKFWKKEEILEAYLNLLFFRGELQGVAASTHKLFNKMAKDMNIDEALLLTVLIRSPNANIEKIVKRFCILRDSLKDYDYEMWFKSSNCGKAQEWINGIIATANTTNNPDRRESNINILPALGEQKNSILDININQDTQVIKTTIDIKTQKIAMNIAKAHINNLKDQNVNDASVVILDNHTGDIVAYVANLGTSSSAAYVDGANARRQAGSVLKPFLYALVLDKKILTADSILDDNPISISVEGGDYNPQNYDNSFVGKVALRVALGSSLNIPAVRVLQLVGTNNFLSILRNLGFTNLERDDYYGPSLALGAIDISLLELANAYRTIANDGIWRPIRIDRNKDNGKNNDEDKDLKITKTKTKKIFSKDTLNTIAEILSNKDNRNLTFGLNSVLNTRGRFPVKTGTSKDMRDNWCVGYSKDYTVAVWAGNMYGSPMWNVSGVVGAAPIYAELMNILSPNASNTSNTSSTSNKQSNFKITKKNNSIFDNRFDNINTKVILFPKITYPTDKMIVALDPDIPQEWQYLFFEAKDISVEKNLWLLNGVVISKGDKKVKWQIRRGKYNLILATNNMQTIEEISFVVR